MKITEKAPAKINLALDVLYKRDDGYHEVEMVMTTIDLADRIDLTLLHHDEVIIASQAQSIPNDHRNLAYQAAMLLKRRYRIQAGVKIEIDKKIPVSAGLAGGSTDAAATLRGLNRLWDLQISNDQLLELAAEIGSDVPFCINGGTALATGRGEKIQPLPALPNCWVILAKPQIGVSTAEIYGGLDLANAQRPNIKAMVQAIEAKDFRLICAQMGNVLESVTLKKYPETARIKEHMQQFGADAVLMSGSGPTVFGLVEHGSRMRRVYNGLMGFCDQIFAVRPLGNTENDIESNY